MGKRWNRKRKAEHAAAHKAAKRRGRPPPPTLGSTMDSKTTTSEGGVNNNSNNDDSSKKSSSYTPAVQRNAKMEAYYTLQGLHSHRLDDTLAQFIPYQSDAEKEGERLKFMNSLRSILPASFRIGCDLDPLLRQGIIREVEEHVGEEIEIVVDDNDTRGYNGPSSSLSSPPEPLSSSVKNKEEEKNGATESKRNGGVNCGEFSSDVTNIPDAEGTSTEGEGGNKTQQAPDQEKTSDTEPKSTINNAEAATKSSDSNLITKKISPARRIPYIPHAYQLSLDRRTIRRNPSLTTFHEWLKVQTNAGFITRQETVSMIPPVVLGPLSHHSILDMCAAPGSKTCQLLEIVSLIPPGQMEGRGFVVANDSDPKRAYMLVHQLRRMNSPNVFVTSCDAQFFPLLKKKKKDEDSHGDDSEEKQKEKEEDEEEEPEGMFDRVLCDVPCSGDGTTRKNPGIWKHWNQLGSLALHPLQLGIAMNGLRLTKVGGYMCYSTCSMNPIENEAVVAEILRSLEGSVELVDKRPDMPGLIARPGMIWWRVMREERSRKDEKNHRKKNNPKMLERRRQWQEKRKKEGQKQEEDEKIENVADNDVVRERKDEEDKDGDEIVTNEESSNAFGTTKEGSKEEIDAEENVNSNMGPHRDIGPPPSWDDETLLERARSVGFVVYDTHDDVPEQWRRRVRSSAFPPTPEEVEKFQLHKCMRCLPHDMDTGGFFVALFRKVAPLSSKARERALKLARELRTDVAGNDGDDAGISNVKKAQGKGRKLPDAAEVANGDARDDEDGDVIVDESGFSGEDTGAAVSDVGDKESEMDTNADDDDVNLSVSPDKVADTKCRKAVSGDANEISSDTGKIVKGKPLFRGRGRTRGDLGNEDFIPVNEQVWQPLVDFYGLSPSFPREQYFARACGDAKILYFISKAVKTNLIDRGIQERVTVINSGLKGFERSNKDCEVRYRVTQEAIHFTAPHMTKRKVVANFDDYSKCLSSGAVRLDGLSGACAEQIRSFSVGAFVVALEGYELDISKKMFMVMWRCPGDSANCLVAKVEMDGMRSKLRALKDNNGN